LRHTHIINLDIINMRSKIIPVVALFITFVTSYLLFAGLNGKLPTHLLLSFLSTNEEKIERALVSSDGLLYYRADGTAGKKAFEFIETEIIKVLEREAPEQAKQYNALKNAKNQTLDYENYGKLGLSYGAVYFNKTHFIDILGVLTGEFEPAETLELLKNDFKKIPNIQIETVGDYSFKVTSAPNPQYMQNFPITLIVEVQKDKIIVATALILLVMNGTIQNYEVIAAIIILTREILVSGLREFLAKEQIKLPVSNLAKMKTFLQMFAIAILLTGETGNKIVNFQDYNSQTIGIILLWLSAFITLYTGYEYLRKSIDHAISEDQKN